MTLDHSNKEPEYPSKDPENPKRDFVFNRYHVWASVDKEKQTARVGITDYLAEELTDIASIDIPMEGDELGMDSLVIHLHVRNRIRHLRCPLTGRVVEVNRDVLDDPSQIYLDWKKAWLFKMEYDDPNELNLLMDGNQYAKHLDDL